MTNAAKRLTCKGRPNHPLEFKRRLAQQACEPGVSVARLAFEHGINANLLRCYRDGEFDAPAKPAMLPVTVLGDNGSTPGACAKSPPLGAPTETESLVTEASNRIEVQFADAVVRIDSGADVALLRAVLTVLRQ